MSAQLCGKWAAFFFVFWTALLFFFFFVLLLFVFISSSQRALRFFFFVFSPSFVCLFVHSVQLVFCCVKEAWRVWRKKETMELWMPAFFPLSSFNFCVWVDFYHRLHSMSCFTFVVVSLSNSTCHWASFSGWAFRIQSAVFSSFAS